MKKIKEIEIDGERIFLKKNELLGWAIVYPSNYLLKKNGLELLDRKTNLKNLLIGGSWIKFGIFLFILFMLLGAIFEYYNLFQIANECIKNSPLLHIQIS